MRKASIAIVVLAAALLFMLPAVAYANFAIHGSYSMDTDACAGCHRAHTSASPIQWTDGADSGSALLLGEETTNYEFCYTCHNAISEGADTNVETGIYEGDTYGANGAVLNGGGFDPTIFPTTHVMTGTTSGWGAYGGGVDGASGGDGNPATLLDNDQAVGEGPKILMTCSACHDVHGSTNYRLLKDVVNGITVGTYNDAAGTQPEPFVISSEPGYPQVGWKLHEMGATQAGDYVPNYTTPMYARAPDINADGQPDADKGMTNWCAACHTQYVVETGTRTGNVTDLPPDADFTDAAGSSDDWTVNAAGTYDAGDGFGAEIRHRHPVNVPLSNFLGVRPVLTTAQGNPLPLAYDAVTAGAEEAVSYDPADPFNTVTKVGARTEDWVDCMTCHVAHGSASAMTGYANVANPADPQPDSGGLADGVGSVPPTDGNALLRMNDRAVCENCHNK